MTFKVIGVDSGKRRISLSVRVVTTKGIEPGELDEEQVVHRKTSAFQKMLKKFLKTAKTEGDDEDEDLE